MTTLVYDNLDRLTTMTRSLGGNAGPQVLLGYDAANRLTRETNAEGTATFTYDNTDQLTGADRPVGQTDEAYAYDRNGNRTMSGYTTTTGNRVSASPGYTYAYDFEGNLSSKTETATGKVTTYSYDHRNRLTGVTQRASSGGAIVAQATYVYDAFDRRIKTETDADGAGGGAPAVNWTVYDGENPYADFNSGGALQTRYLHGPAVDWLLARTSASGTSAWYLTDRLGSVRDIASTSGVVIDHIAYDAYGKITSESSPANGDRFKFTGREYDPVTGLQYNRARYYDATIGRWTQEDPIGFAAGDANLYRYVGNGPTNAVDPSGLTGDWLPGWPSTEEEARRRSTLEDQIAQMQKEQLQKNALHDKHRVKHAPGCSPTDDYLDSLEARRKDGILDAGGEMVGGDKDVAKHRATDAITKELPEHMVSEGRQRGQDYLTSLVVGGTLLGMLRRAKKRLGKAWSAVSPSDPDFQHGCEEMAKHIQNMVGGEVVRIKPKGGAPVLGGFKGEYPLWHHHEVIIKDGRIYDAFTGHEGTPIDVYKSWWENCPHIDFGF